MLIYGFLGVEVFFLISGFVICLSGWGRSVRSFAASRAARLYRTLWAELRFYLLFACLLGAGLTERRVTICGAVWLAASLVVPEQPRTLVTELVMSGSAPYFIAGTAFALVLRTPRAWQPWALLAACYWSACGGCTDGSSISTRASRCRSGRRWSC